MRDQSYGEQRANQATQVALEIARQLGGTFVADADRRGRFAERSSGNQSGPRWEPAGTGA